jgi:hypothetical protein
MLSEEVAMELDWKKVDEVTLALMHLTTFDDHGAHRSWKGYEWDVLGRLHDAGLISNPATKAKSVVLTDEGVRRSRELFDGFFAVTKSL